MTFDWKWPATFALLTLALAVVLAFDEGLSRREWLVLAAVSIVLGAAAGSVHLVDAIRNSKSKTELELLLAVPLITSAMSFAERVGWVWWLVVFIPTSLIAAAFTAALAQRQDRQLGR